MATTSSRTTEGPVSKTLISLHNTANPIRTVMWKPDGGKD